MSEKHNSHQLEADNNPELLDGIHYTGDKGGAQCGIIKGLSYSNFHCVGFISQYTQNKLDGSPRPFFGARHVMIVLMSIGSGMMLVTTTSFSVILVAMTSNNTTSNEDIPTYEWDNKGVILSSSSWLGIPIQLIAGSLGKRYGHKWLILGAFSINSIFFMLIPTCAQLGGSVGVLLCRFIAGGAIGMMTPLSISVSGLWVPAEERSKLGMVTIASAFLFATLSTIGAGQIVESSLGYPGVCYIFGSISLLWTVLWAFLGHQSPATHPRITPEEKKYIETSLSSQKTEHIPVPWKKVLTSVYFWAPVVAGVGTKWIDTLMASGNMFFITKAWKMEIAKSTTAMGISPVVGLIFGVIMAPLSDFVIRKKYIRVVTARKLFHSIGNIGNALCLLWMTFIPPPVAMVVIVLNMSLNNIFIIASSVGGAGLNILDIAPSFAGIIGGFASTFSQCFGLIAPMTLDWIVTDMSDLSQWRIIYLIAGGIVLVTTIFFDIFATDKRPWENVDEETKD